ncbi:MAG: response regulator [bacterium]|nr:response regulator [bacterium]MDZ4284790.1 response regulator [Patescibacteria group bacterium]
MSGKRFAFFMQEDKKHILLVEDDEMLSKALGDALVGAGFAVAIGSDGEMGLALAKKSPPDLMILDLTLPKLDGTELLRRARLESALVDTPTIILTNRDDVESLSKTLESGPVDFLIKHEQRLEQILALVKKRLNVSA